MKQTVFLAFTLILMAFKASAAKVDTVVVYSEKMNKNIKTVIIQPEKKGSKPLATLYLLHGYSGNYSNWVNSAPFIKTLVDHYGYLVVCPDGGFGSWYFDVPIDSNYQYETFVSKELVTYIENNYTVSREKACRAITGLSMGGHGALYLAIKHQDVYGAAGSTAGGVDFRPFPNNWEIARRLGAYADNKSVWHENTIVEMLHLIKPNSLKLFVDCGYDDFFYAVNVELHKRLNYYNIPHSFLAMPGKHNWDYWQQSIIYQMAFFDHFFRNS